jgi:NTE family protein
VSSRAPLVGLVLSGGGARAAYQVGAIRALAEILGVEETPFPILAGVSAGAINAVSLAGHAHDFQIAAQKLWNTWSAITPERVYRTDIWSLGAIGSRWFKELTSGGLFGGGQINHLLDTSPLRVFLEQELHLSAVAHHLERRRLRGVAVSATNYHTGTAVTFYGCAPQASPPIKPWVRSMRLGQETTLRLEHVLASSAIPVFFPPVAIDGASFGDGCVRLNAPLSPAVHLGAERILAIGVRYLRSAQETGKLSYLDHAAPSLSEIGGVLLNAVFLDSLEGDVELLERVNRTVSLIAPLERRKLIPPLRQIPILVLRPSEDLGSLAVRQHEHFPRALRYLLRGIGVTHERGADLLSYLAFAPEYISKLLELGYRDTLARSADVEHFFAAAPGETSHDRTSASSGETG